MIEDEPDIGREIGPRSTITLVVEFPAVGVEWMRAKAALNKAGCFDIMELSQ